MGFLRRVLLAGHSSYGPLGCARLPSSSVKGYPSPLTSRTGWKPYLFPPALHDGEQDTAWEHVDRQGVSKRQFLSNSLSFRGCGSGGGSDELVFCFLFSLSIVVFVLSKETMTQFFRGSDLSRRLCCSGL